MTRAFHSAWALLCLGCSEPSVGSSGTGGNESGDTSDDSMTLGESTSSDHSATAPGSSTGDSDDHPLLEVQDIGWLCNTDPPAGAVIPLEDVLFKRKRRLRFEPGTYDVLGGEEVSFEYWFEEQSYPLVKQMPVVTEEPGPWSATPWSWQLDDDIPGYVTLKYLQTFDTEPPTQTNDLGTPSLVILVTEETQTSGPVESYELAISNALIMYAAHLGPCEPPGPSDFVTVSLEEGELLLETRPGRFASGFLMRASGVVDGIEIDVDDYDDLGMYPHDIDESYLGLPTFAARWPMDPTPVGECGIVVEPDLDTGEYSAWLIDCELDKVRDLSVLSVDL